MLNPTPKRDIPPRKQCPGAPMPDACFIIYEARVLAFNENGESRTMAQGKDMNSCLDCLDSSIRYAKMKAVYLPQETEAEIRVYLDMEEHGVFVDPDVGSYSANTRSMCQIVWSSKDREPNHA